MCVNTGSTPVENCVRLRDASGLRERVLRGRWVATCKRDDGDVEDIRMRGVRSMETADGKDVLPEVVVWLSVCVGAVLRLRGSILCVYALLLVCCGATSTNLEVDDKTQSYLTRFGYLPVGNHEVGNLMHQDALRSALRRLQEFGGIPATGIVDEATQELLYRRRCGRPDREEAGERQRRFAIQGSMWNHTDLTWSLSARRRPSGLDAGQTRRVLRDALNVWAQHSRLTFREVASDDADIVVAFARRDHGDAYPFDGRGHILAHAFFPGTGRGGDAHFDDDENWVLEPKEDDDGTSLFAVAAHEFGHSLGLSHSSEKGALMFPWYQGILNNYTLYADDRNGIQQMYGAKDTRRRWDIINHYYPVTNPPTTTTRKTHHHHHHQHTTTHRPTYPHYPSDPYDPRRRHHTVDYPRQRPRLPETTTQVYYPRRPESPRFPHQNIPRYPYDSDRRTHYGPRHPDGQTSTTTRQPETHHPKPEYPGKQTPKKPVYVPKTTPTRPTPSNRPKTCDTAYDAVALIRTEVFIFKDRWHWRIGSKGLYAGYPIEITRMWRQLPADLERIDAVYERPDKSIVFFIGREYYVFDGNTLQHGYPKRLTELGLPASQERVDAAMVWSHNGKTYFYSGKEYWKYDEDTGMVEPDYPRDIGVWRGIGHNIDAAFQWKDGKSYFFKGKGFWRFKDVNMRVEKWEQTPSAPFWMGCPADPRWPADPLPTRSHLTATSQRPKSDLILLILTCVLAFRLAFVT